MLFDLEPEASDEFDRKEIFQGERTGGVVDGTRDVLWKSVEFIFWAFENVSVDSVCFPCDPRSIKPFKTVTKITIYIINERRYTAVYESVRAFRRKRALFRPSVPQQAITTGWREYLLLLFNRPTRISTRVVIERVRSCPRSYPSPFGDRNFDV